MVDLSNVGNDIASLTIQRKKLHDLIAAAQERNPGAVELGNKGWKVPDDDPDAATIQELQETLLINENAIRDSLSLKRINFIGLTLESLNPFTLDDKSANFNILVLNTIGSRLDTLFKEMTNATSSKTQKDRTIKYQALQQIVQNCAFMAMLPQRIYFDEAVEDAKIQFEKAGKISDFQTGTAETSTSKFKVGPSAFKKMADDIRAWDASPKYAPTEEISTELQKAEYAKILGNRLIDAACRPECNITRLTQVVEGFREQFLHNLDINRLTEFEDRIKEYFKIFALVLHPDKLSNTEQVAKVVNKAPDGLQILFKTEKKFVDDTLKQIEDKKNLDKQGTRPRN